MAYKEGRFHRTSLYVDYTYRRRVEGASPSVGESNRESPHRTWVQEAKSEGCEHGRERGLGNVVGEYGNRKAMCHSRSLRLQLVRSEHRPSAL